MKYNLKYAILVTTTLLVIGCGKKTHYAKPTGSLIASGTTATDNVDSSASNQNLNSNNGTQTNTNTNTNVTSTSTNTNTNTDTTSPTPTATPQPTIIRNWLTKGTVYNFTTGGSVPFASVKIKAADLAHAFSVQADAFGNYEVWIKDAYNLGSSVEVCAESQNYVGPVCTTKNYLAGEQTQIIDFTLKEVLSSCTIFGANQVNFNQATPFETGYIGSLTDGYYDETISVYQNGAPLPAGKAYTISTEAGTSPLYKTWTFKQTGKMQLRVRLTDRLSKVSVDCSKDIVVSLQATNTNPVAVGWKGVFPLNLSLILDGDAFTSSSEGQTDCDYLNRKCDSIISVDLGSQVSGRAKMKFGYRQVSKNRARWSVEIVQQTGTRAVLWDSGILYRQKEEVVQTLDIPITGRSLEFIAHDLKQGSAGLKVYEIEVSDWY